MRKTLRAVGVQFEEQVAPRVGVARQAEEAAGAALQIIADVTHLD